MPVLAEVLPGQEHENADAERHNHPAEGMPNHGDHNGREDKPEGRIVAQEPRDVDVELEIHLVES